MTVSNCMNWIKIGPLDSPYKPGQLTTQTSDQDLLSQELMSALNRLSYRNYSKYRLSLPTRCKAWEGLGNIIRVLFQVRKWTSCVNAALNRLYSAPLDLLWTWYRVRSHQLQGGHMGSTRCRVGPPGDLTWGANRIGPCKTRVHRKSRGTQQVQRPNWTYTSGSQRRSIFWSDMKLLDFSLHGSIWSFFIILNIYNHIKIILCF